MVSSVIEDMLMGLGLNNSKPWREKKKEKQDRSDNGREKVDHRWIRARGAVAYLETLNNK